MVRSNPNISKLDRIMDIGSDRHEPVLLDKNERTVPYSDEVFREIMGLFKPSDLNKYPDQSALYRKLSEFVELPEENLLLVSGADSGLKILFETFVQPRDKVVVLEPTYAMIQVYARIFGARVVTVGYSRELVLDLRELNKSCCSDTKMAVLPNPNQPTGTLLPKDVLEKLIQKAVDNDFLLVLDEAYGEFSNHESAVRLVKERNNLCVLRTFSKAWGLAGVRLGYMVGEAALIKEVRKVKPLLDINMFAIKTASFLIDRYDLVQDYVAEVCLGREYVVSKLEQAGFECISGCANFIHVRLPNNVRPEHIETRLSNEGFRVRTAGDTATVLDGCIRATIGPRAQMRDFVKQLILALDSESS